MARYGNSKTVQKAPEVTFSIELRPATAEQLEAGKRLLKKLVARVQSNLDIDSSLTAIRSDSGARSAPGGTAEPPPAQGEI